MQTATAPEYTLKPLDDGLGVFKNGNPLFRFEDDDIDTALSCLLALRDPDFQADDE